MDRDTARRWLEGFTETNLIGGCSGRNERCRVGEMLLGYLSVYSCTTSWLMDMHLEFRRLFSTYSYACCLSFFENSLSYCYLFLCTVVRRWKIAWVCWFSFAVHLGRRPVPLIVTWLDFGLFHQLCYTFIAPALLEGLENVQLLYILASLFLQLCAVDREDLPRQGPEPSSNYIQR